MQAAPTDAEAYSRAERNDKAARRGAPEHSGSDLVLGLEIEFDLYVVGIAKENLLPTGAVVYLFTRWASEAGLICINTQQAKRADVCSQAHAAKC
jgi:hypothetical protein